ncbi:uncharacterized protein LOC143891010 [Tasmannia lanceolata]|uniref:uncharacterized protein LOC143891010 n=1 Tax=Tasmannia lanceolata TaxID=3420 RepID=UPI0040629B78
MQKPVLVVGMIFSSPQVFRAALKDYAIQHGFDYTFVKNESSRVTTVCKSKSGCRIHASPMQMGECFQIKSYVATHKCPRSYQNHMVTSSWLSSKYLEKIRDDPNWNIHAIRKSVKRDFKVDVSNSKIYRAKRKSMVCIEGGYVEQYARVWDYCDLVRSRNPGSSVKLKVERPTLVVMPTFQRLYVNLHAMRQGFLAGCRPFIGLDGCHLKGPWGRQILSAVGKDTNEQMFPIAYAVVEAELKESWTWFLRTLLNDIGSVETYGWTFISDRQNELVETFEEILPNADHRFCASHMYNNFKAKFKRKLLKDTMWSAAYATTPIEFQKKMEEMEKLDKKAYAYLKKINPTLWSRSAFNPKPKCNLLFNNLSKTFNGFILPARDKPILTLLETIRRHLMRRFQNQRSRMDKYEGPICPKIQEKLEKMKMGACDFHIEWSGGEEYEVQRHGKQYVC